MQVAISQIFPMEVIITILTQAINANQKLQFPKDVMGLLMEILVEVYIKHHQLPQLYGTFNQQQKLKFNLDTLQEKSRTEGEKINDNANNDNEDEDRGSQNDGSNSIDDDLENRSFTNDDGSQNGDNYSQTDSYLSSNTNNTSKHSLYGLQEKPKNSTQQDAIKDIINLILNIAKYITQENFLKLVARGERKTCLLFISSMNLFKFYFLRMKKLDKEFQEIIGYDKMTEILKDFNEKYIIESNTSYKTMTNEENLYLGNALKSILDFVWIERDYKQVKYTGQIWTEVQEFAKQLILQNPYRVYKDGLRVLRVGFISNQQASKAKKSKQEKEQQKLSDVHKFLRIEEKYHTSKDILDRQFVKQIKASKQEPFQDMQLELYDQQKILKDYIIHYDEEIIDFIPLEDQQKQDALYMNFETKIQSIIYELYEQEFKFTSSLHPSKFQALILDILGQEPQFCQAAMKILQKDFFPVSNIYENIQNAQISTTKGESHLIKHLDDLKKKFRTSLYPNLLKKITKETPSQVKKTIPLFVSKPDQLLPGLLEIFHVQFSKSIKCKYCGRWYTHTDVNQEQAIMKGMMAINLNEDNIENNLIVDHKIDDSDGEMSDLDNADQTNKKMIDIEHYNIHEVVNNCKNSLPQEYVDKIIKSRKLKKYTFGHLEEEKAEVEKEQRILNYKFNHINHNPQIPEQNIIDITKQNLMEQKGFNKIIFDFIKKTFFKIENDSVLQGLEKHDDILLLISYCYKFTYYYILNHEEHTKEIIADDKLWECMTQMMSVKDNPKYNHIVLDAYDIIIEVMKNEDNINFLKEKSLNFLDLFLKDVCAMDINTCCDKNFKILQMGNYIIKGLSAEDKDHIREYIKQFQLDQVIKTSAKMFFVYDEIGNIKKFIGDDLFIQLFREEYDHIKNEQEKQYALYANYYQRHQYSKLNYYLELFEFLSSFVAFLPTEFSGLVINSTEKQNIVIQNEILNYILDFKKPVMCYLFYINVYLYSQDLNEDNSLYVFLQEPENLKNFFTNFENQKNYIEEFKTMMENCKYDDKLNPDYLLKEALIVRGIMPTISNMVNERFIYLLFSQYLKLQKLHTSSYQKVLKSISLVMFNNEKYRQCLIEESKDLLSHENILQLKQSFIEQQTKGIGALSQDMVQKKLRALNAGTTPQEDLNTLQQMKNNAEKNTEKYKSLKLKILEYKTREKERSKRAVIPTFIKEFKRLVSCICELGFHLPFFTKSDNQKQIKDFYNIIFKNRFINEKLKNNSYLQDRQLGSVKKLMRYYEKLDYKGYNNNFTDISLQNVKKFLNHEIIPIALKAMKKELLHKHQKSFQTTFEEKIQYNQIITQINDPQLNEEFFFFMSPFEDLLLYLVYNSDTTVVDPNLKEKAQIEAANKKKFEEIIQKKYKAPKTSIKEIFGQDYYRIFERKENISNILTYIFHYIESTLDNLENKKMFILAKNYIRVLQSILFKYGATCQKCEYYEFKDSKMKLKEEQIKEENQMTLEHIQDYLIEYYDAPRMVCSALMESYIQLDKIQNDKAQKESNNFLPYLIQIMKFANVLISNYNESGQEEFLNVIQGHHSAFMMKNQMVIFGIQKIMRYCSERIKNGANEEVQQTTLLAESMLKFFQDLCDGNNKNAQDFLRNQPNLLKSVNLVYEISVMADYFIENIKQQFFIYVNLQEKELKIFKKLFGKQNRDYQNSLNKKHKKFWNFYKTKKHRVDIFQPLIQCFKTIIELINGPNIENIKVIINTLSPQKINLTFEFLNSYFMKFDFKVPKTGQTATYYGCFALSQEYLKTLTDNNPEEALFRSVMFGQKGSENVDNDMYEEDEDEDQQQIQQHQNLNSTYNSETTLINKTKFGSNSTMARPRSNQIQPIASGIIKANKIKIQVNRGHAAFSKTIVAKRSQLREIYKTRQFLMNLEQKKIKFTQTLYELEKSMLDYLNFLFQSRNSIESANKTDNSFQEYLNNFDYSLLLDNLQQRFDQKVESSYSSRVILAYYSVFLANLQNELSTEQNLIMEKFLLWENQDFGKRDHKKFIGSIEVVNESSQLQRIFFKIPKSVLRVWNLHIMQEKRNEIIDTVKRDNPEDKVKDLFDKFNNLEHMIEYQNYIYRILNSFLPKSVRDFSFYKLKNSNSLLTKLFILLNLIQNIFQISYTQSNETNFYYEDESSWVRAQFEIFAFLSIIIIIYLTFTEFIDDFIFESIEVFYRKEDIRQQSIIIRYFTYVQKILKWLGRLTKFLGSQTSFWVHCTIATTQVLGYSYDSSFFAYGLIMIIWGIDFTKEIINAVFSHIDQVIGSILLSIIVLYWFVIIAYNAPWNAEYGFESQMNCDSLVHCIQVHFDYGYLTPPIWNLSPLPISGTIWTFFFNLFVNIILTAIISGIIIDTFGERREQKKQIKSDTLNKCFICNIEREEFERSRKDFNHHEIEEHNKYNYLFYNIAVKKMTPSTRTNIDDWIVKNNEDNTIKHIPIQRCLMLQQYANQDSDQFSTATLSLEFSQMRDVMEGINK
ncbi:hypothetical protein PPERSA_10511 [Pseudocohnilembus persalinus]|uniref:RyR/IP3R Homology associated domain-containing protein n=1 Tax=Pseudocohnilembus persalinus TaxID=266149 RepID=A0A0V0R7F6_PSEPJ|nr:hypothetical protein PPERSA_10511 [Pseudocohnilembus persalinus]|eukprot:KRX10412.1 hypothetical protein PPERSA_10511 [Pseudocohnilembus persalinus]